MDKKKPKKKVRKWPKLSGIVSFKAMDNKIFPVFVGPNNIVRITSESPIEIDCSKMPHSALNSLKLAVADKDVEIIKGGK